MNGLCGAPPLPRVTPPPCSGRLIAVRAAVAWRCFPAGAVRECLLPRRASCAILRRPAAERATALMPKGDTIVLRALHPGVVVPGQVAEEARIPASEDDAQAGGKARSSPKRPSMDRR